MSQAVACNNKRLNLRVSPEAKAKLVRAATLRNTDLTNFVIEAALREAEAVIEVAAATEISGRAYTRVLELLENPPCANTKLRAAINALPHDL